jgi:hypothetical protein
MDPLRNAKRRASARSPGSRRGLCQTSLSSLRSGGSRSSNDKGFFSILYRNELRQDLACRKHSFTSGDLELQSPLQRAISCDSALLNRLPAMQLLRGGEACGAHSLDYRPMCHDPICTSAVHAQRGDNILTYGDSDSSCSNITMQNGDYQPSRIKT